MESKPFKYKYKMARTGAISLHFRIIIFLLESDSIAFDYIWKVLIFVKGFITLLGTPLTSWHFGWCHFTSCYFLSVVTLHFDFFSVYTFIQLCTLWIYFLNEQNLKVLILEVQNAWNLKPNLYTDSECKNLLPNFIFELMFF